MVPARLCRWSGLVVSFLNSTTRTRPDQTHGPLGSPTSPRILSGRRLVRSISTRTDFARGSGLVGSQTKSVGPCIVELRNDTTSPDQRQSLAQPSPARAKFHYTDTDRTRPDQTCRKRARIQRTLSETRVGDGLVECGRYLAEVAMSRQGESRTADERRHQRSQRVEHYQQ